MLEKFKKLPLFFRIITISVLVLSAIVVIFSLLFLTHVISFDFMSYFVYPSMAIILVLGGIRDFSKSKTVAIFNFLVGAFIVCCCIFIFSKK